MVDEALAISGRLDVLVNNAAANLAGTVVDMDLATWHEMLDTNLTGTFLLMKAAIPPMIAAGGGSIINMGSLAGVRLRARLARLLRDQGRDHPPDQAGRARLRQGRHPLQRPSAPGPSARRCSSTT